MDCVTSWSYNDLVLIQVELRSITPDGQTEQCWDVLRRKGTIQPLSCLRERLFKYRMILEPYMACFIHLQVKNNQHDLSDYARLVQRELKNLDGVGRVSVYGVQEECINIEMLPERMATLGVSPAEVLATLKGQNGIYYSGYYDNGDRRVRVTVSDKFQAVEQIRQMIIQGRENDRCVWLTLPA